MAKFTVTIGMEVDADTAEEAALMMYRELSRGPVPVTYRVTGERHMTAELVLDPEKAEEYALTDHTADPGNW
ncbi:hypothetical protein NN6n1_40250 [Shinella zoogloeoides]